MSPLEYLALAEAVLIDGPQDTSTWAAVEFIRKARQRLPVPASDEQKGDRAS